MSRYLIFNADDYGMSPAVSLGIRRAASSTVRSTTVMTNLATHEELVLLVQAGISTGVHLNLSCGEPLISGFPGSMLTADGSFSKELALTPDSWRDPALHKIVQREWEAQILALSSAGLNISHLDSHHHVHLLEPLFPVALELALNHGFALRTDAEHVEQARLSGVTTPDALVTGFFGNNNIDRAALLSLLQETEEPVVEVMSHPGQADELLALRSGYVQEREKELQTLGDPSLVQELEREGWRGVRSR